MKSSLLANDVTPSQMVRQLVRDYIEQRLGPDWREQVFTPDSRE